MRLLVAENLNHQVFYQFTVPTLIADGEIRLSRESQYERLDMVVRNTIHGLCVEHVNIYDKEEILLYSTDNGKDRQQGRTLVTPFTQALNEESVSVLSAEKTDFFGFELKGGTRRLTTYLPMWEERPLSWRKGKVLGVFEITQDVTHGLQNHIPVSVDSRTEFPSLCWNFVRDDPVYRQPRRTDNHGKKRGEIQARRAASSI